jgi:DNA polymerase I-like protein with 3'-5' exonuclease and polymerase domains
VNHPVQGLGAELVKEFRIGVCNRLPEYRPAVLFSSVHDDLKVDTPDKYVYNIKSVLEEEAANVPKYMKQYYNMDFNLPFRIEVSRGMNCNELEEF